MFFCLVKKYTLFRTKKILHKSSCLKVKMKKLVVINKVTFVSSYLLTAAINIMNGKETILLCLKSRFVSIYYCKFLYCEH